MREIIVNITFNNSDDHFAKKEKKILKWEKIKLISFQIISCFILQKGEKNSRAEKIEKKLTNKISH